MRVVGGLVSVLCLLNLALALETPEYVDPGINPLMSEIPVPQYGAYSWPYTLGYHFIPQEEITVVKLGRYSEGTKKVSLWDTSTGELLASVEVFSGSPQWAYGEIEPVQLHAYRMYTVASRFAGSGVYTQQNYNTPSMVGSILIEATTYCSGDCRPITSYRYDMYGLADIELASVPKCIDDDGDGYGQDGDTSGCAYPDLIDCNDDDPAIHPGADEVCNGSDDDCDGTVDGISRYCYSGPAGTDGVGICHGGSQTCSAGSWGLCGTEVIPRPEGCDGQDDDCNGAIDDRDLDLDGFNDCNGDDRCVDMSLAPAPVPFAKLGPNHHALDAQLGYGCSCAEVLSLTPGISTGEYRSGCSEGTRKVWLRR